MRARLVLLVSAATALAVMATLFAWLAASAPARVAHGSAGPAPTRLWYRIVFYGASETLSSHPSTCGYNCTPAGQPRLFDGTLYDEKKTIFSGHGSGAVILTQDADGTVHTTALLAGNFRYSEHLWNNWVNGCTGGEVTQAPIGPGVIFGQVSIKLRPPRRPPRRRKGRQRQPTPSAAPVTIALGQKFPSLDNFTYTATYCPVGNQTSQFGPDGYTTTNSQAFGLPFCGARSIEGKVRFGQPFSIRTRCQLYMGEPETSQATTSVSIGIYFQLCGRGGRAVNGCKARPIRHPWPAQSPL